MKNNRSVERALSILLYVCQSEMPVGLAEISRSTGLDKATALRLLKTLADADMVSFEQGTKNYIQGPGIYNFWPSEIRKICRPFMYQLLEQVNESICIIVPRGSKRVCIDAIEPERELRIVAPIGRELPIVMGASGRVFMAYKDKKQVQNIFDSSEKAATQLSAEFSKVGTKDYMEQLEEIRNTGFAYNVGEVALDTSTIAAPVFDALGNTAAALVVRGPSTRMDDSLINEMAILVRDTAQQISDEMAKINI